MRAITTTVPDSGIYRCDCNFPVYNTFPNYTLSGLVPNLDSDYWWINMFTLPVYYVNSATGNDENNIGRVAGSPLKTITEAVDRADGGFGSDDEGCNVVINVVKV